MDGRDGSLDQLSDGRCAAEMFQNSASFSIHETKYAIIGSLSQAPICDNRHCENHRAVPNGRMAELRPETRDIFLRLESRGLTQRELADELGIDENKVSKVKSGIRQFKGAEMLKAVEWLDRIERGEEGIHNQPDLPLVDPGIEYVPVEVLPTFGGMGGGGNGDGDVEIALIPRALIVDVLRGQPSDFLLINVRGDSMEPDFHHGDQILIDRRDTSPAQPGPFALWDGEWGEYVVKNVERSRSGEVRIFSSNGKYSAESAPAESTRIIGRPVWFGRRL